MFPLLMSLMGSAGGAAAGSAVGSGLMGDVMGSGLAQQGMDMRQGAMQDMGLDELEEEYMNAGGQQFGSGQGKHGQFVGQQLGQNQLAPPMQLQNRSRVQYGQRRY